jgi:hypothetical protein
VPDFFTLFLDSKSARLLKYHRIAGSQAVGTLYKSILWERNEPGADS